MLNAIVWTAKVEVPQGGVQIPAAKEPPPAAKAPARAVDSEVGKVEAALPTAPVCVPRKPQLLVYTRTTGYIHDSIPLASRTFELLGKKTGAFTTTVTDDPRIFAAANLAAFDAILMNNSSGALADDPALQQNVIEFVRGGKGIIGIHSATWNFGKWPAYVKMMGADFAQHPFSKITVKLDDPASPINAGFKGQGFAFADEIYVFTKPYSRQNLHVLLSIDWEKSQEARARAGKNPPRSDNDYALSWIRPYGQGRVFYCAFGHFHQVFWDPAILQHLLAGIQYSLGDLKADATPLLSSPHPPSPDAPESQKKPTADDPSN